jgi:hypothetical protein
MYAKKEERPAEPPNMADEDEASGFTTTIIAIGDRAKRKNVVTTRISLLINVPSASAPAANAPSIIAPSTNAPSTNTPSTNTPSTNAPLTNTPLTNAPFPPPVKQFKVSV